MKLASLVLIALVPLIGSLPAAEPKAVKPHPVTLTFYVSGMECGACMDFVGQSIRSVKSVTNVEIDQVLGIANVSFDTHVSSAHQIAQAVVDAFPLHGKPYQASLKIRVPDYAKDGNAAKVDAVFAKPADWVKVEAEDKAKGEFVVRFLPLQLDRTKSGPQGWNPGRFGHAIHDPAPKGLGLAFALVKEGQPEPEPKKKP